MITIQCIGTEPTGEQVWVVKEVEQKMVEGDKIFTQSTMDTGEAEVLLGVSYKVLFIQFITDHYAKISLHSILTVDNKYAEEAIIYADQSFSYSIPVSASSDTITTHIQALSIMTQVSKTQRSAITISKTPPILSIKLPGHISWMVVHNCSAPIKLSELFHFAEQSHHRSYGNLEMLMENWA